MTRILLEVAREEDLEALLVLAKELKLSILNISASHQGESTNWQSLKGTVVRYDSPFEPVALGDWEILQ